jgi:glycosyltransferase involved in cell wall biosynthesis
MRYVWSQTQEYARHSGWATRIGLAGMAGYLKSWEQRSAERVDAFFANSQNVARRIAECYGRAARVIYPPIDTEFFTSSCRPREDFYLMVSALVPYKCIDHAIEATARLGRRLRIIGGGPMLDTLRKRAPANVEFLGWHSDSEVREHYRRCRALLLPGEEDFGMAVVESMACGTPVIAVKAGGAMETVADVECGRDTATGVLYEPQTVEGLIAAVKRFESAPNYFDPQVLRRRAEGFSQANFRAQFAQAVDAELSHANGNGKSAAAPALRRRLTSSMGKIVYPAATLEGLKIAKAVRPATPDLSGSL